MKLKEIILTSKIITTEIKNLPTYHVQLSSKQFFLFWLKQELKYDSSEVSFIRSLLFEVIPVLALKFFFLIVLFSCTVA